ncbi:MAG: hypothetical protein ACTSSP_11250 [Candidatus Asgardarchaeia archaeon]
MAGIGNMLSDAGIGLPNISKSSIAQWSIILGIAVVVAIGLGFFIYWFMTYLKYNKKIKIFRKVGTLIMPIASDSACFERVGAGGDYWCRTKKTKKILPRPKIQMDKNEFWFYEREDGEWINFALKDFDIEMKQAGAYYVDEDMRLQRLGIQKNLQERFNKVTFWDKYFGMIMTIVFIMIITICLVVLFNKMEGNWEQATRASEAIEHMAKSVDAMTARTTSGVVVATSFFPLMFLFKKKRRNQNGIGF